MSDSRRDRLERWLAKRQRAPQTVIQWLDDGRYRHGGVWVAALVIGDEQTWPVPFTRYRTFWVLGMRVAVNEDEALRRGGGVAWGPVRACADVIEEELGVQLWNDHDLGHLQRLQRQEGRPGWWNGYTTVWDVLHTFGDDPVSAAARDAAAYSTSYARYVVPQDLVLALPPRVRCDGCGRGLPRVTSAVYPSHAVTKQPAPPGSYTFILKPEPWCPTCTQRRARAERAREALKTEWREAARVLRQARQALRETRTPSNARTGGVES